MEINPKNWPEGTKIEKTSEGKTEIILPRPTDVQKFNQEKRGAEMQQEKMRKNDPEIISQPQKNPDTKEFFTATKELQRKLDMREEGKRSQKHFRRQGKSPEQREALKLKKQKQTETPWWYKKE